MTKVKSFFKMGKKGTMSMAKLNLAFVLVGLNVWDWVTSKELFNAMILGLLMFGLVMVLWVVGSFRAVVLATLISIFEFVILAVFILEGFEVGGASYTLKSIFWLPYLLMAATNAFWGLKIYAKRVKVHKVKKVQKGGENGDSAGVV